ncbi:MAG TPA: DUF1015 family protein [Spirochaetota bacterium]|nr:DUF1015 family protein [Spirochaetota bacterium]HOK91755.1 DUF1015 family protein [Spirochaetota bacterium]HPP94878.1 DUF1015 family protein [Spirochaetota bacterium]HRU64368.1 DUF1015 family protein [Spirochaetota bacterium]
MAKIKAFRALRPKVELASQIAELPYDVVSLDEVKAITKDNIYNFYHITRSEADLPEGTDPYSQEVYIKAKDTLDDFIKKGYLIQEESPKLYLYSQIMDGRMQTGIVACASIDDYMNGIIKKHELTREDKELDRTRHTDIVNANTGPVFLFYKDTDEGRKNLIKKAIATPPIYDFTATDGIRHIVRIIDDETISKELIASFEKEELYIADGHHRAASGVRVGKMRREKLEKYTGDEEFNYFLSVIFPHSELKILSYNRVVKDLNSMSVEDFKKALGKNFKLTRDNKKIPERVNTFSMYLQREWYTLTPLFEISNDPIESLDVTIIQKYILEPLLGIKDPRKDKRIDFIGGIRGTAELERVVDAGDFAVAFSMYPTEIEQLIKVSDAGLIMPPKSTWFEPKLRDGLLIHLLD